MITMGTSSISNDLIDSLLSLPSSDLTKLLESLPKGDQEIYLRSMMRRLKPLSKKEVERDRDAKRKREKRSEAARIVIPDCVDPQRRERCLADPALFMKTYFPQRYRRPFSRMHEKLIDAIYDRVKYGGRKSLAAVRGIGKSEIVKGMLPYIMLAQLTTFVLPVAATTELAKRLYKDFKDKFAYNELLAQDFPEVCYPVKALDGAPQRAGKQHVDGQLTRIVWTSDGHLSFPYVPGSPYGGYKLSYAGLDAAFRGCNIDGQRPTFVLIDDPETRESADSEFQCQTREDIIEKDIAGLKEHGQSFAMLMITTVQNRNCVSFRYTDRKTKPAWDGERYGLVTQWPTRMDLWWDYVAKRKADQEAGDRHGGNAVQFYLDNFKEMNAGHAMIDDAFDECVIDGKQYCHTALQAAWNQISDTSYEAFCAEFQNDPPKLEEAEGSGLTSGRVMSRSGKLKRMEVPREASVVTIGWDIGKFASHWVCSAWQNPAIGWIPDYGITETNGLSHISNEKAIETAITKMILDNAETMLSFRPSLVLIDSGDYTEAVYAACRELGAPFFPSKGWDSKRYRHPQKQTEEVFPFLQCYARLQPADQVWLYNVHTEFWKPWVHERFITSPTDSEGIRIPGSLELFDPEADAKLHMKFAQHIIAEELQIIQREGERTVKKLVPLSRNNHYLDAIALAAAAAGCLDIRVVGQREVALPVAPQTKSVVRSSSRFSNPNGKSFVARR